MTCSTKSAVAIETEVKGHVTEDEIYISCFKNCYKMVGPILFKLGRKVPKGRKRFSHTRV